MQRAECQRAVNVIRARVMQQATQSRWSAITRTLANPCEGMSENWPDQVAGRCSSERSAATTESATNDDSDRSCSGYTHTSVSGKRRAVHVWCVMLLCCDVCAGEE